MARSCDLTNVTKPEGVSPDQKTKLSDRVSKVLTVSQQWFTIWDILFPNVPRPASPLVESPIYEVLSRFRGFWDERGQEIISEHLQRDDEIDYSMPREERDLGALHATLFHQIMGALVDRFIHQFVDDSTSASGHSVPTPPSNDDARTRSGETSTASSSREEPGAHSETGTRPQEQRNPSTSRGLTLPDFFHNPAPGPSILLSVSPAPITDANTFPSQSEPQQVSDTRTENHVAPLDWQVLDWWTHTLADNSNEPFTGDDGLSDFTNP